MTVIAYKDGVIAADTLVSGGSTVFGETTKIFKSREGHIVGCAGLTAAYPLAKRWVDKGCDMSAIPNFAEHLGGDASSDGCSVALIVVEPEGQVLSVDCYGNAFPVRGPFFAEGSGAQFALGAMAVGANAIQAVQAAISRSNTCGGQIQYVELNSVIEARRQLEAKEAAAQAEHDEGHRLAEGAIARAQVRAQFQAQAQAQARGANPNPNPKHTPDDIDKTG